MTKAGWAPVAMPLAAMLLASASPAGTASAQALDPSSCCTIPAKDFPKVGGNYGNQNYSSLSQITKKNVGKLGGAWHVNLEGGSREFEQEGSVIAVDGVLYIETTHGNVHAVDGKTGKILWTYKSGFGPLLQRGVAVGGGKVYASFAQNYVAALDQKTGKVLWQKQIDSGGVGRMQGSFKSAIVYYDGLIYFGTADSRRGVAHAVNAETGEVVWRFYGTPETGEFGNDTWEGDSWKMGGGAPWMHPAVDPKLGLVFWTFGNARNAQGMAVDGSMRGGQNLFANSLVAIDAKTGKRAWHFQSVHHDIWDMDNVMAPVLADIPIKGVVRPIVIYGSKTGMFYVFDRRTGEPITPIVETPVPQQPLQKTWPTQPIPQGDALLPLCVSDKTGGATQVPPNYQYGCLFTPHLDFPVIQSPGTGGGMDWSAISFNPNTKLAYVGVELVNVAHIQRDTGLGVSISTGFRPLGQRRSGKIVAFDPATHKIAWEKDHIWGLSHGNGMLSTAGDVMFFGQQDGLLLAIDPKDGKELWKFQTGSGVHSSPATYEVDGEQYVAVFAGGARVPYNSPQGDDLWAFKLGGTVPPAPTPTPPSMRQPITAAPVEGATVGNTVNISRLWTNDGVGATESTNQNAMAPQALRVPVGTKVTFTNPAGNAQPHCVTQFYEGLFASPPLKPGQSYTHTFTKSGEYFYNDCTSPPTTGKVIVYDGKSPVPLAPPPVVPNGPLAPAKAPTASNTPPPAPAGAPPAPAVAALPPGPNRDYVQATCGQCHDTARIAGARHTRQEWSTIVGQMMSSGLALDTAQRKTIEDYLTTALAP